jgi:cell division protease FtsH
MPRGWALGVTWQLPEQDQTSHYKDKMLNELSILFGGRIAEESLSIQIDRCIKRL